MIPFIYKAFRIAKVSHEPPFLIDTEEMDQFDARNMTWLEIDARLQGWADKGWSWEKEIV
jgi:hypothetical protein